MFVLSSERFRDSEYGVGDFWNDTFAFQKIRSFSMITKYFKESYCEIYQGSTWLFSII